ncbi:copper resistance protein CopC [Streptomyces sp. NPDC048564]|uniref:copper resistance CopC family protein n=1 Tax=Streptomyces sp. NPDC048564 TaxID=3155760 RepID=UPI0034348952
MRGLRLLRAASAGLLGCLCVLLWLGGTPAYAHSALRTATPAPGAKVAPGVDVVSLTFGRLKSGTTPKISLTGPDGTAVPVGRPVVAGDSVVCAVVAPLRAGVSTLSYAVTSADGDSQSSAFQFEVSDGAEAVTTPSACQGLSLPEPDTGESPSEGGTVLGLSRTTALSVGAVTVVVIAGGGVLALRTRRAARSPTAGRSAPERGPSV